MQGSPLTALSQPRQSTMPEAGAAGNEGLQGSEPELDLDRLVWDPEYRKAMLPVIKRGA